MPDIGVKITLQGEAQYRQALRGIKEDQRVLESQMKLVKAQFDGQEKSIEGLASKKALLSAQLGDVQAKMDLIKAAIKNASDSYGEFDTKTMNLKSQFFDTAAEAKNLENQINALNEQLKQTKDAEAYQKAIQDETTAIENADTADEELEAQMKLLDAQMRASGGAADTLKAKQQNLAKQIENGEKRVEAMRSALEKAEKKFGTNSEQARQWRIKLYEAETQLAKTQDELGRTGTKLDEFGEKLKGKGWGDAIDGLTQKFGVHLPNGIKTALNGLGDFDVGTTLAMGGVTALVGVLVKAETALWNLTKEAAANADQISTLSVKTGISTTQLQEYAYAAERLDVDLNTITTSHTRLVRAMESARMGSEQQLAAFYRLGIQFDDAEGNLRDVHDVYWEIIDALGKMTNETDRDATAMELLGRNAQDLNPLIEKGAEYMEALAQEAHDVGYVLSEEDVEALSKVDDQFDKLNKKIDTVKKQVALDFAPSMEDVVTKLGDAAEAGGQALTDSGIVDTLGYIIEDVGKLLGYTTQIEEDGKRVYSALQPVALLLAGVAQLFENDTAFKRWDLLFTNPKEYIENLTDTMKNGTLSKTLNAIRGKYEEPDAGIQSTPREAAPTSGIAYLPEQKETTIGEAPTTTGAKPGIEPIEKGTIGEYAPGVTWTIDKDFIAEQVAEMNAAASAPFAEEIADEVVSRVLPPLKRITDPDMAAYNAIGSHLWRGGWTRVGENGPEDVKLPAGSEIHTAQDSRRGGDTVIYVNIDAKNVKEFNDVVRAAENARMELRRRTG